MSANRIRTGILLGVCFLFLLMCGCGGRSEESVKNELAYRDAGIEKLREGAYEEAVQLFQQALDQSLAKVEDLEVDICYYKAEAEYKSGDADAALATYTALIEYDKENVQAYYLRGTLYLAMQENEKALIDYKAAIGKEKKNGNLHNRIAENLLSANCQNEAQEILTLALEIKGDTKEAYREKGYTHYLLEDYEGARTYLDKAIGMGDKEAVFYLAKVMEASGQTEQANQLYESYVVENSSDTVTLNALGCARMEEGKYDQALVFFETALNNENPINAQELRRNEIIALEYMLDFAQAREKMKLYLEDYPNDEAAAREYEFLQTR